MANSGVVVVTELRKFVNGVDTGQVKPNVAGDPDYVAPYLDILTCLPNTNPVTTTTSTSTTTTTSSVVLSPFILSTHSHSSTIAACAHPTDGGGNSEVYFSGKFSLPAVNDVFYIDNNAQNLLGGGIYYSTTTSSAYTVSSSGVITSIFACAAPTTSTTTTTTQATTTTSTTTTTTEIIYDYSCNGPFATEATLDLSYGSYPTKIINPSDTSTNVFNWVALDRPNRFNVYNNGNLIATSGWVGVANYPGPWGMSLSTPGTGSFSFSWTSTSNREVRIEYGASDPNNQIGDGAEWSLSC